VRTTPGFTVTARRGLVDDRFVTDNGVNMDVTPNGKLLVLRPAESVTELSVVVNWLAELDRRLRGAR
jgi:hypothetical protein